MGRHLKGSGEFKVCFFFLNKACVVTVDLVHLGKLSLKAFETRKSQARLNNCIMP